MKRFIYIAIVLLVVAVLPVYAQGSAQNDQRNALICLEFHDIPVRSAIDSLFKEAGVKYMIGPGVKGTISNLSLRDFTIDQAIKTLVFDCGLIYRKDTGNVYKIYAKQTIDKYAKHPNKRVAVTALVWFLRNGTPDERYKAVNALINMGEKCNADALAEATKDESLWVRFSASEALANMGDQRAVTQLVKIFLEGDPHIQEEAGESLAKLGGSEAINGFAAVLKRGDVNTRAFIVRLLGDIEDDRAAEPLAHALKDKDDGVRFDALRALAGRYSGRPSVAVLTDILERRNEHHWTENKVRMVTKTGAVPVLIRILKTAWTSKEGGPRGIIPGNEGWLAAELLGRLKAKQAVEPLIASLECKDDDIFALSVWALGEIGDNRAIEPLFNSLGRPVRYRENGYDEWVYNALWKYGKSAEKILESKLKNGNADQRTKAAIALKFFQTEDK